MTTKISSLGENFHDNYTATGTTTKWVTAAPTSFKNYIINGDFSVDAKWDGAPNYVQSGTGFGSSYRYTPERWLYGSGYAGTYPAATLQRVSTANSNYYANTVNTSDVKHPHKTALRISNNDTNPGFIAIAQRIEALNCVDLNYEDMTLSCWLRGDTSANDSVGTSRSVTWTVYENSGTTSLYGLQPHDVDYWTYPGYATSPYPNNGNWQANCSVIATGTFGPMSLQWDSFHSARFRLGRNAYRGLMIEFKLYTSSSSTEEFFQITGIQLERGKSATPFEMLTPKQQLKLCNRYSYTLSSRNFNQVPIEAYWNNNSYYGNGYYSDVSLNPWGRIKLPTKMRTSGEYSSDYYGYSTLRTYYGSFDTYTPYINHGYSTYTSSGGWTNVTQLSAVTPLNSSQSHVDINLPSTTAVGTPDNTLPNQPATSVIFSAGPNGPYIFYTIEREL